MNYGYPPTRFDKELAKRLTKLCQTFPKDSYGMSPYVEINGLYSGVRIRRITHYSDFQIRRIVEEADKIYNELEKTHV